MKDKKTRETFILGRLDKKTILAASPHAFIIKERIKTTDGTEAWASKYYYAEIGDAIRGYARHLLRRPSTAKHLDGSLQSLIDLITKLETTIKKVGEKLNAEFAERLKDPIESHLFNAGETE